MDFMGGLPLPATISLLRAAVAHELVRRLMSEPAQTQMPPGVNGEHCRRMIFAIAGCGSLIEAVKIPRINQSTVFRTSANRTSSRRARAQAQPNPAWNFPAEDLPAQGGKE
jgi:hypothetical protein